MTSDDPETVAVGLPDRADDLSTSYHTALQWCADTSDRPISANTSDPADVHLSNETSTTEQPILLPDPSYAVSTNVTPEPEQIYRLKTSDNPMILDQVPSVEPSSMPSKDRGLDSRDDLWTITSIEEHFDELYQSYVTNLNQYENLKQNVHGFAPIQQTLTPISEESLTLFENIHNHQQDEQSSRNDRPAHSSTLTIQRQANHIGHYGFELQQDGNNVVRIASIIDGHFCPNLDVGDEVLSVNQRRSLVTMEDYHSLFHLLWHQPCEYIQITVRKPSIVPSK